MCGNLYFPLFYKNLLDISYPELRLISAGEQADFDGSNVTEHQLINETDIAPWRTE